MEIVTLVLAGRDDFIFPPKHQEMLAAGIPNSRLVIIDRAGHNVHDEQSEKTIEVVRDFLHTAS
jgi:proline iminopeptidase